MAKGYNLLKDYENKDSAFWKNVILSDESKFNLFGSDGRQMVWRKVNKENLLPTVKHGVVLWWYGAATHTMELEI